MKRLLTAIFLTALTILSLTSCTVSDDKGDTPQSAKATTQLSPPSSYAGKKVLVAYFSRTGENYEVGSITKGNTHIVADIIAELVNADKTFEIVPFEPYPETYQATIEQAKQEQVENARPRLATSLDDMAEYDVIFLGYPIWWSNFPMPVYTFFESYDFKNKTIIPFCTSAGDQLTGKEEDIPTLAKGSSVTQGYGVRGKKAQENPEDVRTEVIAWLKELGYK